MKPNLNGTIVDVAQSGTFQARRPELYQVSSDDPARAVSPIYGLFVILRESENPLLVILREAEDLLFDRTRTTPAPHHERHTNQRTTTTTRRTFLEL